MKLWKITLYYANNRSAGVFRIPAHTKEEAVKKCGRQMSLYQCNHVIAYKCKQVDDSVYQKQPIYVAR